MKIPIRIAHIDTITIARRYIVANFKYEDFLMVDSRFADEIYYLTYIAKDFYDRDVEMAIIIDLLHQTITGSIILNKDELQPYL